MKLFFQFFGLLLLGSVRAQVPASQCPVGEAYIFCGNACAENKCCEDGKACDKVTNCPAKCDVRCECLNGHYRDANTGRCVQEHLCTKPAQCGANEMWNACGSSCREPECSLPVAKEHLGVCPATCTPRCECKPGYTRHFDGTCVAENECYSCGINQTLKSCGSYCREPTCGMPNRSNWHCDNSCTPRCECDAGYVRNFLGSCIEETECPNPFCPVNEEVSTCYNYCEDLTCDNYDSNLYCPPVDADKCTSRCKCKAGYVRNSDGHCVLPEACPAPWCGYNASWTTCGSSACEATCASPNKQPCSTSCEARCQCLTGFYRNAAGYCVPYDQCPPSETAPCGINEYFNWCGNECLEGECSCVQTYGYHCLAHKRSNSCPSVCQPRCECQAGFVRDDKPGSSTYGQCVTINSCLAVPTTTPVTVVTTTAPHVPPTNGLNCGCDNAYVASSSIVGGTGTAKCTGYGKKSSKGSTWLLTCSTGKTLVATMGKRCQLNQKLNCDPNAPAIDCGCNPTTISQQYVTGGAGGKAECLSRGKKGSKGSIWKLSCTGLTGQSSMKPAVNMGKNCQLQDSLWCGTGPPPVTHHCGCQSEVYFFKNVKCIGDNVYSCTGLYGETQTFSAKKCSKISKKHKCAFNNTVVNPVAQPKQ